MTMTRRLRVLHVGKFYPPHVGGIETHLQALCNGLQQSVDLRVIVASGHRRSEVHTVEGVEVVRAGTAFELASAQFCPSMVRRIRETDADVVHIHLPNPTAILAYLASRHPGRLVLSYHSDVVRQKVLNLAFEPILRRALDRASAVVVASPDYLESSPTLQPYRDRSRVIPYGIPLEPYQAVDSSEVARIRQKFGPRLVVGVGRLVYYKGFEYLIGAMSRVRGQLVILGDGPLRQNLQRRAAELGVADRVTFLGRVDDLLPYYHAADLFVLASVARSEAFGIVQIEAMACGKPVVNTSLASGVPFVSRDGETGLTVPPQDSAALAQAINRLLDDEPCREAYGAAARQRAYREFGQDLMVQRTLELYEEVMGARSSPARSHQTPRPRLATAARARG